MERGDHLIAFFKAIHDDHRIGPSHISVYVTLLQLWFANHCEKPLVIFSHDIKPLAKINSSTTYHRCLKDLNAYGYLNYHASFKRGQGSKVYFILCE